MTDAHDAGCEAVYARAAAVSDEAAPLGAVECDLPSVRRALEQIDREGLSRGRVFCDWGSGSGSVVLLAAALSFEAYGLEIEPRLVAIARTMAADLGLDARFTAASFLRPGDEGLVADAAGHVAPVTSGRAECGLDGVHCDIVFAYPWPGDEDLFDALFLRHATRGDLFVTHHGSGHVLIQRHVGGGLETIVRS